MSNADNSPTAHRVDLLSEVTVEDSRQAVRSSDD